VRNVSLAAVAVSIMFSINADRELAFRRLHELSRHHHLTAAVKLLADWLWANDRVAAACASSSRALWSRLVCFVNLLPTDKEMLDDGNAVCQQRDGNCSCFSIKKCEAYVSAHWF